MVGTGFGGREGGEVLATMGGNWGGEGLLVTGTNWVVELEGITTLGGGRDCVCTDKEEYMGLV